MLFRGLQPSCCCLIYQTWTLLPEWRWWGIRRKNSQSNSFCHLSELHGIHLPNDDQLITQMRHTFLLDFVDIIIYPASTLELALCYMFLPEFGVIQHFLCRYPSNSVAFVNNMKSKSTPTPKWRRVVFKVSGTALAANCQSIDPKVLVSSLFMSYEIGKWIFGKWFFVYLLPVIWLSGWIYVLKGMLLLLGGITDC